MKYKLTFIGEERISIQAEIEVEAASEDEAWEIGRRMKAEDDPKLEAAWQEVDGCLRREDVSLDEVEAV